MPVERVFVASPISAGGRRIIASPFEFFTTGEDNLRVTSANALVGVTLAIQGRMVNSAGEITAARWAHTPNSDRSTKTEDFPLGVGAVMDLVVFAASGAPLVGQTFVIVHLVRGLGAAAIVLGTLLQGYVTSNQVLAWPGSPIQNSTDGDGLVRSVLGADPVAGTEWIVTVPTGARWELLSIFATLQCSAAVATRLPMLLYQQPGGLFLQIPNPGSAIASQTIPFAWAQGLTLQTPILTGAPMGGLPTRWLFLAGGNALSSTLSLQAADNWSAPSATVREWLEVA